jgi:hypothetical protein
LSKNSVPRSQKSEFKRNTVRLVHLLSILLVKIHLPWRIEFARQLLMGETPRRDARVLACRRRYRGLACRRRYRPWRLPLGEDRTGLAIRDFTHLRGFQIPRVRVRVAFRRKGGLCLCSRDF